VTPPPYGAVMATTQRERARSESSVYRCTACAATSLRWVGRCPGCGEWNTFAAARVRVHKATGGAAAHPRPAVVLRDVSSDGARPLPTGVSELDRVMGGGVVGGSVTLLFGPPGIGKSTLLFQVLASVAATGVDVMLASAEESLTQVSGRASRIGPVPRHLLALEGPDIGAVEAAVENHRPAIAVVDSLQSVADPDLPQPAGSLAQVRACVERLTRLAKATDVPLLLVGHVTKDGDLAGPRAVEHLVDTVLSFDGDRHHALRVLTSVKHRFGPTGEVGIFEMRDDGLRAVPDPGPLMLGDRMAGVPGSVVAPVLQGRRPLLVEVQALLGPGTGGAAGRPHTLGIDAARANLLMAVLACRTTVEVPVPAEFFVAAVGGISVTEPAADLAVALAMASVARGRPVPADLVAFGELGLAGEVRTVPGADRRLAEAHRAGFTRALVPASTVGGGAAGTPPGLVAHGVRTLADALDALDALAAQTGVGTGPGTMPRWQTVPGAANR
jgi:DNA repair protein RadA/Sms